MRETTSPRKKRTPKPLIQTLHIPKKKQAKASAPPPLKIQIPQSPKKEKSRPITKMLTLDALTNPMSIGFLSSMLNFKHNNPHSRQIDFAEQGARYKLTINLSDERSRIIYFNEPTTLGQGEFGIVKEYTIEEIGLAQAPLKVAIKFCTPKEGNQRYHELEKHRAIYSTLKNKESIVPFYTPLLSYDAFLMPVFNKGSLYKWMQSEAKLLTKNQYYDILNNKIFPCIIRGVTNLHDIEWVHYDLTSHNIFIDTTYKAYIGDFGCARTHDEAKKKGVIGIGTQSIQAPEIFFWLHDSTKKPNYSRENLDWWAVGLLIKNALGLPTPTAPQPETAESELDRLVRYRDWASKYNDTFSKYLADEQKTLKENNIHDTNFLELNALANNLLLPAIHRPDLEEITKYKEKDWSVRLERRLNPPLLETPTAVKKEERYSAIRQSLFIDTQREDKQSSAEHSTLLFK